MLVLGRIGETAARWPIQIIVMVSLAASVGYMTLVNINVNSFRSHLSRSFYVENSSQYAPASVEQKIDATARFVGAPVSFYSENAIYAAKQLFPESTEVPASVLIPEQEFLSWVAKVRRFTVESPNGPETWRLSTQFSWVVWVKWAGHRIYDLMKAADDFDLFIVTLAWISMYWSFYQTWRQFKLLGSRVYLFLAALISSSFSFLIALAVCTKFGVHIPLRHLAQGIPFFVLVVGFDTKIRLARESLKLFDAKTTPVEAISTAVRTKGIFIFKYFGLEFLLLLVVSFLQVPGLTEFTRMVSLLMLVDAALLVTFYVANLSIKLTMVRAERNEITRRALEEDGVDPNVAQAMTDPEPSGTWKLVQALVPIGLLALNSFVSIPVSPFFKITDLWDEPEIAGFAARVPPSSLVTVLPTLKFEPEAQSSWIARTIFQLSDPLVTRALVFALGCSLILNIFLVQFSQNPLRVVEKKVPIVVERRLQQQTPTEEANQDESPAPRSLDDCAAIMKAGLTPELTDDEIIMLGLDGKLPLYALEKQLKDTTRAVVCRRAIVSRLSRTKTLESSKLPWRDYDYDRVLGACCENVIGYLPLPIGVAGPIIIDGISTYLPLATTEGVLVASTMRGCKAINSGGGVTTEILADGMTRGPCVTFSSLRSAASAKRWLDSEEGAREIKKAFDSTSRFARLCSIKTALAGTLLFIRFRAQTGDAMGMNMISKGVEKALEHLSDVYNDMSVVSISGNYCTDKKAAAINWIEGRGKSVVAEATVPGHLVRSVLKTGVDELVELNNSKNLVGSALAGAMGGFNAHAANLVAALFLATGQDPAQVVEGSNCMTLMNNVDGDLQISVSMPSLEVGTIGGGTILEPQAAVLEMLGVKGPHADSPGDNARQLARIVASAVLAGELSLCSALAAGHLVKSHMAHNRSKAPTAANSTTDLAKLKN